MLKRYCNKISQCLHIQIIEENHHGTDTDTDNDTEANNVPVTITEPIDNIEIHTKIPRIDWYLPKQPEFYYREKEIYQKFYLRDKYYIDDFGRKRTLFKNYKENNLPLKGWLHECMNCYTPTARHFILEGVVPKNIYAQICSRCYCKLEHYRKYQPVDYSNFISELNYILEDLDSGSRYISY